MALAGSIRKLWQLKWVWFVLLWTVLGLAFSGQSYLSNSKAGDPVSWSFTVKRELANWYVFAVLSLPALWVARRFPLAGTRWKVSIAVHVMASLLFSVSWMVFRAGIAHWQTRGDVYPVAFTDAFSRALVATLFFNQLIYWGVVIVQHAIDYYWKFHERELHTADLETRLTEARLQALQMQLNPHFLFNTLNAIAALMHKDVEAADRMIVQLSDLLRYALESTESQEVPLRQELDFLDRYLRIQQARFGERLSIQRQISPEALDALVPNLILQPIVENAIQHGIEPYARPGIITLRATRANGELELQVQDNGTGPSKPVSSRAGVGVANTRARLQQLYGEHQRFEMRKAEEGGMLVRILIPWRRGERALS
jgi:signal transduction histidine kinase